MKYPWYVMQFDHVRGKKVDSVSQMRWGRPSMRLVKEEIAKCELVCGNCHAIRTHKRRFGPDVPAERDVFALAGE
jgi:hypothetical protein